MDESRSSPAARARSELRSRALHGTGEVRISRKSRSQITCDLDFLAVGVTGFEPAASSSRSQDATWSPWAGTSLACTTASASVRRDPPLCQVVVTQLVTHQRSAQGMRYGRRSWPGRDAKHAGESIEAGGYRTPEVAARVGPGIASHDYRASILAAVVQGDGQVVPRVPVNSNHEGESGIQPGQPEVVPAFTGVSGDMEVPR